jgi:hypothetical protein
VLLIEAIREYDAVPERYRNRLRLSTDVVAGTKYIDMRALLTARLLLLSLNTTVRETVGNWRQRLIGDPVSDYDRRLLQRLLPMRTEKRR